MKTMKEIHSEGAKKYGPDWLHINQKVVNAADSVGIDYTKEPIKLMLSMFALEFLELLTTAGTPDERPPARYVAIPIVGDKSSIDILDTQNMLGARIEQRAIPLDEAPAILLALNKKNAS